jgi:hypothetical protein
MKEERVTKRNARRPRKGQQRGDATVVDVHGRECLECGGIAPDGRECHRCGESGLQLGGWIYDADVDPDWEPQPKEPKKKKVDYMTVYTKDEPMGKKCDYAAHVRGRCNPRFLKAVPHYTDGSVGEPITNRHKCKKFISEYF